MALVSWPAISSVMSLQASSGRVAEACGQGKPVICAAFRGRRWRRAQLVTQALIVHGRAAVVSCGQEARHEVPLGGRGAGGTPGADQTVDDVIQLCYCRLVLRGVWNTPAALEWPPRGRRRRWVGNLPAALGLPRGGGVGRGHRTHLEVRGRQDRFWDDETRCGALCEERDGRCDRRRDALRVRPLQVGTEQRPRDHVERQRVEVVIQIAHAVPVPSLVQEGAGGVADGGRVRVDGGLAEGRVGESSLARPHVAVRHEQPLPCQATPREEGRPLLLEARGFADEHLLDRITPAHDDDGPPREVRTHHIAVFPLNALQRAEGVPRYGDGKVLAQRRRQGAR